MLEILTRRPPRIEDVDQRPIRKRPRAVLGALGALLTLTTVAGCGSGSRATGTRQTRAAGLDIGATPPPAPGTMQPKTNPKPSTTETTRVPSTSSPTTTQAPARTQTSAVAPAPNPAQQGTNNVSAAPTTLPQANLCNFQEASQTYSSFYGIAAGSFSTKEVSNSGGDFCSWYRQDVLPPDPYDNIVINIIPDAVDGGTSFFSAYEQMNQTHTNNTRPAPDINGQTAYFSNLPYRGDITQNNLFTSWGNGIDVAVALDSPDPNTTAPSLSSPSQETIQNYLVRLATDVENWVVEQPASQATS